MTILRRIAKIVEKNYGNIIHVLTCILQGVSVKLKSMER